MSDEKSTGAAITNCFCTFAIGMAFPIVYYITALSNQEDTTTGYKAKEMHKLPGCEDFTKIDTTWALILSLAIIGTVWALIQAWVAFKGGDNKSAGIFTCVAFGPFICSAMILDIWINIPVDCQKSLEKTFDSEVSIWTAVQMVSYLFIVGLSCMGCMCLCLICAMLAGVNMREMATMGGAEESV